MPISRRTLEAGEFGRLDAGGDVHCFMTVASTGDELSDWGQNDYNVGTKARFFGTKGS
jgi:hypothetical protein